MNKRDTKKSTTDTALSTAAKLLGSLGGKKGGKSRALKLSPERRSEIARNAVNTRWEKSK